MSHHLRIALDIDDVVFDWVGTFVAFVEKKTGVKKTVPFGEHHFGFKGWYEEFSPSDLGALAQEFNAGPDFMNLPEVCGAARGIRKLLANGHQVFAVSACGDNKDIENARRKSLADLGLVDIHLLPLGSSKKEVYEALKIDVVIDDHLRHVLTADGMGLASILVDHPTNQLAQNLGWLKTTNVVVAKGWPEIVDLVGEIRETKALAARARLNSCI